MLTVPAPTHAQEEWPDADFELPEGDVIRPPPDAESDKEDEEDWDIEMDLGSTGGAKAIPTVKAAASWSGSISKRTGASTMVTIRPPISTTAEPLSPDIEEEDEGISTIKVSALPTIRQKAPPLHPLEDEDMEADFALPSDLTQLSLRPLELNHKFSKGSLEWGDRDHTSSSASSDAYSTLGFGIEASPSTSSTSASLPGTDDDCDNEEDGDLDGLVIPTGLFETEQGRKHLTKILDMKKKTPKVEEQVKVATPDPEDDFEIGLVINGDDDLNPLKLAQNKQTKRLGTLSTRSNSAPARPSALRPPSRLKSARPKTPLGQSGSSTSSRSSLSPPHRPSQTRRAHTFQAIPSQPPPSFQPPSSFLAPKQTGVRNQKSHSALKSPSPPNSASRKLSRKASLSSLLETSNAQIVPPSSASSSKQGHGYSAATASSKARVHTNSTSRMHSMDVQIPPTRPSTPSSNSAALRLTLPTSMSRMKSRPAISSVFPGPSSSGTPTPSSSINRSPPGPSTINRPPSRASPTLLGATKFLRRTKRRIFGDGTELDGFEDLPTDRDKEAQFRVHPKGSQNRVPGGSYPKFDKESGRGTIRGRKEASEAALLPTTAFNSLRHKQSRLDALTKAEQPHRKKSSSGHQRRKPTLIRNLGGANAPKVVGEMRWNPQTLRWEGNDQILRDFDAAIGTSSRPALITHLTGSSIGSPVGNFGAAARVVGNMVFDPVRMCWMSTLPPDEDEPDVFADMADDEEDGDWETKGGTIRASLQISRANTTSTTTSEASSRLSDASRMQSPSPVPSSRIRSNSESGSERGSRASIIFDVEDNFVDICREAESRHRTDMKGWTLGRCDSLIDPDPNRSFLYEIRALATRQY